MLYRIKNTIAIAAILCMVSFSGYSQYFIYSGEQPVNLDLKFTQHSIESAAKHTFFNSLKIVNRSNRSETFTLNFTVPDGWNVIGESRRELTMGPNDSIMVPVMVAIGGLVRGDIGYSVIVSINDTRGNTVKNEYCFVKIPREANLEVRLIDRSAFLDQRTGMASVSIKLDNKGNREELVNFLFKADPELSVGPTRLSQFAQEVVMPPYSDTIVTVDVLLKDIHANGKNMYGLSMATTTMDTTYKASIWFRKLEARYINYISESQKPLVFEINFQGLLQDDKVPSIALRAEGKLLLKDRKDIYYYYRNFNSRKPEELYLYNQMYIGSHIGYWQFEVGDAFRTIESSLAGRGLYVAYATPNFKVDLIGSKNLRSEILNLGSSQRYRVSQTFELNSGIAYNKSDVSNFDSKLALLGTSFTLGRSHRFYLMGAYNILNQDIDGKSQHSNYGGEFRYSSKFKNFNTTASVKYGSNFYYGNYRGRLLAKLQSIYTINPSRRIQLNGFENWNEVPTIRNGISSINRGTKNREIIGQYFEFVNQNVMLSGGFGYEGLEWKGISQLVERSFINTHGFKALVGARFRLGDKGTYLSPQVTVAKSFVLDYPDEILPLDRTIENRTSFSYQHFTANLRSKNWGLMTAYTTGPMSMFEQYTYFFNARPNRRLRVMPYTDVFIYKDQLQLMANLSFSNDLVARTTYTNITSQLYWFLRHHWRLNFLVAYSLQNRTDAQEVGQTYQTIYLETGVKKEFSWSHPRISYHNVTFVFFKDYNGNGVQEPNEPGIKNVMVNFTRELTPELGFIPGDVSSIELLSDDLGMVMLEKVPAGIYTIQYNPVGSDAGTFSKAYGDLEMRIDKNATHPIPFVEKNKVFGKIILNRSRLSGLGRIDISNVRVTATDSHGRSYTTLTDKDGSFVLFAPVTDEYILNINNIFYENFDLRQNNFLVQFNGYKQFEVNFVFDEKVRRINFAATATDLQMGIQQVRRTNISGTIKDANTQSPVRARINLINTRTNSVVTSTNSSATSGDYTLTFMAGENYLLEVLADDYWYLSENLILQQVTTFMNITRDVMLKPIAVGSKLELNIRFDVNSDFLMPESVAELNRLLRQLKNNPTVRLQVQGHCDDLEALRKPGVALDRANAVAKYLIENGYSNLEVKGLANTAPVATNDTEEGRIRNRRVEVEVLSK